MQCFVPMCNHKSEKNGCKMFSFPKSPRKRMKWKRLIRRSDVSPTRSSRVCSCHFREGNMNHLPELFSWNKDKLFSLDPKSRRRMQHSGSVVQHLLEYVKIDRPTTISKSEGREDNVINLTKSPSDNAIDRSNRPVDPPITPEWLQGCIGDIGSRDAIEESVVDAEQAVDEVDQTHLPLRTGTTRPDQEEAQHLSAENQRLHLELDSLKKKCSDIEARNTLLCAENDRIKLELERLRKRCSDFVIIEAENTLLHSENDKLKADQKRSEGVFLFRTISDYDDLVSYMTGLPNSHTFFALLRLFDNVDIVYYKKWKVKSLDKETQLLVTLMKLRRGLSNNDLAVRFKVHCTTIQNIFISWIMALHHILVKDLMKNVPSTEKNQINLPECFKEYPRTRIIIDCTEVTTADPTLVKKQNEIRSNYKHRIASKAVVGIAPNGTLTFVSELYVGSSSDRKIVMESGVLNCLVPGDTITADEALNIRDLMPDGVELMNCVARDRTLVDQAIARIRKFKILHFILESGCQYSSEIFQVCAALINFQKALIV